MKHGPLTNLLQHDIVYHGIVVRGINMRFRHGQFDLENLAPLRLLGFYWDVNHDGSYMLAFCFWEWFIGISVKDSS